MKKKRERGTQTGGIRINSILFEIMCIFIGDIDPNRNLVIIREWEMINSLSLQHSHAWIGSAAEIDMWIIFRSIKSVVRDLLRISLEIHHYLLLLLLLLLLASRKMIIYGISVYWCWNHYSDFFRFASNYFNAVTINFCSVFWFIVDCQFYDYWAFKSKIAI